MLHALVHQGLDLQLTSEELHVLSFLLNMLGELTLHPTRVLYKEPRLTLLQRLT